MFDLGLSDLVMVDHDAPEAEKDGRQQIRHKMRYDGRFKSPSTKDDAENDTAPGLRRDRGLKCETAGLRGNETLLHMRESEPDGLDDVRNPERDIVVWPVPAQSKKGHRAH